MFIVQATVFYVCPCVIFNVFTELKPLTNTLIMKMFKHYLLKISLESFIWHGDQKIYIFMSLAKFTKIAHFIKLPSTYKNV
jgi:hypothetical protein